MNRRLLLVLIGLVLVAGAIVTLNRLRSRPESSNRAATAEPAALPPPIRETPRPEPPRPEPPPLESTPRAGRRAAVPPAGPTPSPAPTPAAAAPDIGILHIDSDIAGAQVFIDREYIGATPVTAPGVKPGTHHLNLSAEGYDGIAETIEVSSGSRDLLIKFKEVRLDSKIDVVHKHRFGSCEGVLIATPRNLRYETTDKDDRFIVQVLDLDKFEVDYLKRNLKVKLKKGKEYNFADPEGNADRLFVFQRDVEKARERLQNGDRPASE